MSKCILIGGYYGAGNLGDEAILDCMLKDIRAQQKNISFIITSWNPKQTSEQFNVDAVHWKDIPGLLEAGKRADMIILGGGGLFQDYWGIQPDMYLRRASMDITAYGSLPLLAQIMDIPCMIYAMGLGPLQSDLALEHTRLAFDRSLIATLRDRDSLELLKKTGFQKKPGQIVEVTADPVFTLKTSAEDETEANQFLFKQKVDEDTQLIAVSLRFWDQAGSLDNWLPRIAEGLNRYLAENDRSQLILLPFQSDPNNPFTDDLAVLKYLYQFLSATWRVHLLESNISPRFAQALIKKCSAMVGMRLHSLVLGINAGTPIIALPYDPKVSSLMKEAGLEKYCCESILPNPEDLATLLRNAVKHRTDLNKVLQTISIEKQQSALKNTDLIVSLLKIAHHKPLSFMQEFAANTLLQLEKSDEKLEHAQADNEAMFVRIQELEAQTNQLAEIQSSRFWKLAKLYYQFVQDSPLRLGYQFLSSLRQEGLIVTLRKALYTITKRIQSSKASSLPISYIDENTIHPIETIQQVIRTLNLKKLKGIFVLTSAFPFDEFYNQRVINLSKFLSAENWGVIYIAWRWTKNERISGIGQEVYRNVFQIPVDLFLENQFEFSGLTSVKRYFVVEFPHPEFFAAALQMRKFGYKIIYEIIDEWEEFHKVGQAIWFNKGIEEAIVINANILTAVSLPLIEKFSTLRKDIRLLPNGFDPEFLGRKHRGIAKHSLKNNDFNIGYFGHLTDSWFDWDFLFSVLEITKKEKINLQFHLIGYGEPDLRGKLEQYQEQLTFHGRVQPAELWRYAKNWDAALICFKSSALSEAVDPIKVYEYGFFGLPVLVKGIPHLASLSFVKIIQDEAQFIEAVRSIQITPNKLLMNRRELDSILESSTWKKRFAEFLEIVEREEWMFL